jgi:hypothetical protein
LCNTGRAVALATHDGDAAVETMRQHLDTSLQNTLRILDGEGEDIRRSVPTERHRHSELEVRN